PDDDVAGIVRGGEIAAARSVPVMAIQNRRPALRLIEVAIRPGRREKAQRRPGHVGVIGRGGGRFGEPGAVRMEEPASGSLPGALTGSIATASLTAASAELLDDSGERAFR